MLPSPMGEICTTAIYIFHAAYSPRSLPRAGHVPTCSSSFLKQLNSMYIRQGAATSGSLFMCALSSPDKILYLGPGSQTSYLLMPIPALLPWHVVTRDAKSMLFPMKCTGPLNTCCPCYLQLHLKQTRRRVCRDVIYLPQLVHNEWPGRYHSIEHCTAHL